MEKKWTKFRIIAGMCAALGWWGLLYPELALTPDTVKVIYIDRRDGNSSCRRSGALTMTCIWSFWKLIRTKFIFEANC